MTKELLIITKEAEEGKLPKDKNEKEKPEEDYKSGLSDFELNDFLSYLDNLKLDDKVSDKNELERRGGGNLQKKGSNLRSKGPGGVGNKSYLYTAVGINSSCQQWTRQQRNKYYNQLSEFYHLEIQHSSSVKGEEIGQDVIDGPGTNLSHVQVSSGELTDQELDTDAAPFLESIGKSFVDSIPALSEFLHKDLLQYENERYDALTPYSQSTKSPEGPDLNDVMEVISDEDASKSPPYRSPDHNFTSHISQNKIKTIDSFSNIFSSDKLFKEADIFTGGNFDFNFNFNDSSTPKIADVFSDDSELDLFKPFDSLSEDNKILPQPFTSRNELQALKDRERNGLVLYDADEVPVKRHQSSALSDQNSNSHIPIQIDPEIEKMLLLDSEGDSIIHSCIIAGITLDGFENLLESLSCNGVLNQIIDKQNGMWRTALFLAVMEKRTDLVDCLISYHANPNIQGKVPYDMKKDLYDLRSPLHLVAGMGDEDIELLRLIIECDNLDIDCRSSSDRLTALHIALLSHKVDRNGKVIKNCMETVRLLVDHGADINIVEDRSSRTPVMLAIETADFQLVKDFLASMSGNDTVRWALQDVTRAGDTPLHLAAGLRLCPERKAKMIRFLVKQGANTNAENNIKELPEDVATKEVWRDLFKVK